MERRRLRADHESASKGPSGPTVIHFTTEDVLFTWEDMIVDLQCAVAEGRLRLDHSTDRVDAA